MFDTTTFSLASAVADNGTVTVGYPDKRSQGDYDWSPGKHVLFVAGNKYVAPADFTLTFNANASDITLTNKSGGAWASGSACRLQIDRPGPEDKNLETLADTDRVRQIPAALHIISLGSPDTADANGYVESQDLTSAGVFSVDTTAAAAIAAAALAGTADVPRNVVASWTGTAVLTITGTDEYGNTVVESSASGTSLTGKKAFKTVTGISASANITALTVGTGDVLGLPVKIGKAGQVLKEFQDGVDEDDVTDIVTLTDSSGYDGTHNDTIAAMAAVTDLTDNTGDSGTHDDTLADGLTAAAPASITEYTPHASGGTTVTSNAATDLDTTAAALNTLVDEVQALQVTVAACVTDLTVQNQNDSDMAQKIKELVARDAVVAQNISDLTQKVMELVSRVNADRNLTGTLVAGVGDEATATTGDVRGTYDPADAADGDDGYKLLVVLPNPADKGVSQYDG